MKTAIVALLIAVVGVAHAQTAYRWVDQDGKVHYGDRPPLPKATREIQEKRLAAPAADNTASFLVRDAASKHPVTLYVSSSCNSVCQDGREFLLKRGIPFKEKALESNEDIEALKKLLGGGDAMVPSLQVGTRASRGFLDSNWDALLDAAGYPRTAR